MPSNLFAFICITRASDTLTRSILVASPTPAMSYYSRSPPPLQHPVPTHPAFIPEPPSTPASPQGYQRFASSPPPNQQYAARTQYNPPPFQPIPNPQHQHIPDFAAWGMNDTTAQFGMHLGQTAVAAGQDYVQKNVRVFGFFLFYSLTMNSLPV
jgi:hypothetical protein